VNPCADTSPSPSFCRPRSSGAWTKDLYGAWPIRLARCEGLRSSMIARTSSPRAPRPSRGAFGASGTLAGWNLGPKAKLAGPGLNITPCVEEPGAQEQLELKRVLAGRGPGSNYAVFSWVHRRCGRSGRPATATTSVCVSHSTRAHRTIERHLTHDTIIPQTKRHLLG
jgi:hypothetical protein